MSLPIRLGLFYSAIFIGTGASSPYMPVWFADRGLSGAQIGLILSLPMLARAFTAPLLAVWADSCIGASASETAVSAAVSRTP